MVSTVLQDLARAKAMFQQRAVLAAMGVTRQDSAPEMKCEVCGDDYPVTEMPWGMCPDCWDNFERKTLEERLEDIGIL